CSSDLTFALESLRAKVLTEEEELAIGGYLIPIQDSNAGQLSPPRPLAERIQQDVKHAVPGRQRAKVVLPEELPHHRQTIKHGGERIVVGRAGRRLGVVLGQAQPLRAGEEGVES